MRLLPAIGGRRGQAVIRDRLRPVPLPHARFCVPRHGANNGGEIGGQRVTCPKASAEIQHRFGLAELTEPAVR
jgi:hypothetical protein